jgi:glycosyltransferase involved in cell wall biosynthesis
MSRRPRVLYVAPVEPWGRENGSSVITADLLDCLAAMDEVELLAVFVRPPPPGYKRSPPGGLRAFLLDIPGLPRWLSVVKAAALWSSPLRHRFDNRKVARAVADVLSRARFQPDLVHVEHLPLVDIGVRVARPLGKPLVYRAHNVESRLWGRRLQLQDALKTAVISHMERVEADAVRAADLSLFISEGDLQWARSRAPSARSELLPCTLRLERYDAIPGGAPRVEHQICFVGGLDWGPNEDGLRWFVLEVLPKVTSELPSATLAVLARGASERPWLREHPAIRVLEPVADAASVYASSQVSIAPFFQGGGVRIKIPESLALGCSVVSTSIGAEGHELPGLIRADDPDEFCRACVCQLRAPRVEVSALRSGVRARYGADLHARRLVEMWSACAAPLEGVAREHSGGP